MLIQKSLEKVASRLRTELLKLVQIWTIRGHHELKYQKGNMSGHLVLQALNVRDQLFSRILASKSGRIFENHIFERSAWNWLRITRAENFVKIFF